MKGRNDIEVQPSETTPDQTAMITYLVTKEHSRKNLSIKLNPRVTRLKKYSCMSFHKVKIAHVTAIQVKEKN